jgi:Protein of unknown function (DUF3300)
MWSARLNRRSKVRDKIVCREAGPNIVIASANPNVVYAPYYNPAVVYGTWPWAEYPPVYFSPGYFGLGPARGQGRLGLGSSVADRAGPLGLVWGELGNGVVDGGGYSRIADGNAAWGGGNWQHPGGGVSHGGFGGGMGAGSSQPGAGHPSGGQLGFTRASGGRQGGGGGHQSAAHASGGQGGGGHPSGGGHPGGGGHHG